ncbi:hypothetical protein X740_33665 [Mesorhizobium sp. LNHC221B00]|uniref:hypothetical protein n=1 Tax=Mesorhizobium sp. LNHC221B00 TaxID=1287233 RepID=UPI0003CEA0CE|nr:hypothetical protein [Mesorhizobium sp. LNHC221B00]ESY71762.1 hypothetical protein X740_33665 [Mesorhizobium sp. LNHC221B00]
MTDKTKSLAELETDLGKSVKDLELADEREREAARNATAIRNRINDLHKLIDMKIAEMRTGAPCNTEWANMRTRRAV